MWYGTAGGGGAREDGVYSTILGRRLASRDVCLKGLAWYDGVLSCLV